MNAGNTTGIGPKGSDLPSRIKTVRLRGDQVAIARRLGGDLHRLAFLSGPELARECGVSVSAITRFAQKLGYGGFPGLKKALEGQYRRTTTPYEMFQSFAGKQRRKPVADLSLDQDLENLSQMRAGLEPGTLRAAVAMMARAPRLHLAAIGSAEILVDKLSALLSALEKPVHSLKSCGITRQAEATDFAPGELLVGFSFQRILREVPELFRQVKPHGVKTLAVTDSPVNPLALEADLTLLAPVIGTTFGLSLVAPLALVNVLANSLAALDPKKSLKALEKAKQAWEKYPIFCEGGPA